MSSSPDPVGIEVEPPTIDRRQLGLTRSQALGTGGLVVGNHVTIELAVETFGAPAEADA